DHHTNQVDGRAGEFTGAGALQKAAFGRGFFSRFFGRLGGRLLGGLSRGFLGWFRRRLFSGLGRGLLGRGGFFNDRLGGGGFLRGRLLGRAAATSDHKDRQGNQQNQDHEAFHSFLRFRIVSCIQRELAYTSDEWVVLSLFSSSASCRASGIGLGAR